MARSVARSHSMFYTHPVIYSTLNNSCLYHNLSFLQILPTAASLFFFSTDSTHFPDCLPTLMIFSAYPFLLLSYSFFIPAKARDYIFTGVGLSVCLFVCLFVTTITK